MSDTDEITRLRAGNERLLAANRDVMLHWEVLQADYERLRAALEKINVGEGWAALIARAALDGQTAPGKEE